VVVIGNPDVKGFVMVEQVKSIDYRARPARSLGKASEDLLDEVLSILDACIYWRPNPSLQPTRNPRG
jgi:mRNA interferase MazF